MQSALIQFFTDWSGHKVSHIDRLPKSGSDREYYRITSEDKTYIGVYNPDRKENEAFISFTRHFLSHGLAVPELLAEDLDNNMYLLQDLGNTTLFKRIQQEQENEPFSPALEKLYRNVIERLPEFQVKAGNNLDFSRCYPRDSFDRQSMQWDLNYFKYYFIKLAGIPFDEQSLENDFNALTSFLMEAGHDYFMYRDFQSRNIMLQGDQIFFIDYQGGRKGALQYDIASLLFDAKANLPNDVRDQLLGYYLEILKRYIPVDQKVFKEYYTGFVLIRIMQAMGAYGFRGFFEKKKHFLASIPYAQDNLRYVLDTYTLPVDLPALKPLLFTISKSERLRKLAKVKLKVAINSFSFKRGIPMDESGHGGGHVFDCRVLPNPGRLDEYRWLTGMDQEVIDFLREKPEVIQFFNACAAICSQSVRNYQDRQFANLSVNFGCTGGQHRSVYMAERMAHYLRTNYDVDVVLRHREQE